MGTHRVLVVEDDRSLADIVVRYLQAAGYDASAVHDGPAGLQAVRAQRPDLVVLDLNLPGMDGLDVCQQLRREGDVAIVMATARSTEDETLLGLDLGADDYVAKPFSPRELVARVRAVLRRVGTVEPVDVHEVGGLVVDVRRHRVTVDGTEIDLTPKEFDLLAVLVAEPGRAFSRTELSIDAFGWAHDGATRTVDVHVLNLRRKLGDQPDDPRFVETVYGVGYRLREPDDTAAT